MIVALLLSLARIGDIEEVRQEEDLEILDEDFNLNCIARKIGYIILLAFSITAIIMGALSSMRSSSATPH